MHHADQAIPQKRSLCEFQPIITLLRIMQRQQEGWCLLAASLSTSGVSSNYTVTLKTWFHKTRSDSFFSAHSDWSISRLNVFNCLLVVATKWIFWSKARRVLCGAESSQQSSFRSRIPFSSTSIQHLMKYDSASSLSERFSTFFRTVFSVCNMRCTIRAAAFRNIQIILLRNSADYFDENLFTRWSCAIRNARSKEEIGL